MWLVRLAHSLWAMSHCLKSHSYSNYLIQSVSPTDNKHPLVGYCLLKFKLAVINCHLDLKQMVLKDQQENIPWKSRKLSNCILKTSKSNSLNTCLASHPFQPIFLPKDSNHKIGLAVFQKCFSTVSKPFSRNQD